MQHVKIAHLSSSPLALSLSGARHALLAVLSLLQRVFSLLLHLPHRNPSLSKACMLPHSKARSIFTGALEICLQHPLRNRSSPAPQQLQSALQCVPGSQLPWHAQLPRIPLLPAWPCLSFPKSDT